MLVSDRTRGATPAKLYLSSKHAAPVSMKPKGSRRRRSRADARPRLHGCGKLR